MQFKPYFAQIRGTLDRLEKELETLAPDRAALLQQTNDVLQGRQATFGPHGLARPDERRNPRLQFKQSPVVEATMRGLNLKPASEVVSSESLRLIEEQIESCAKVLEQVEGMISRRAPECDAQELQVLVERQWDLQELLREMRSEREALRRQEG